MQLHRAVVLPLRAWQAQQVQVQGTGMPHHFRCQGSGASVSDMQLFDSWISIADSLWQSMQSAQKQGRGCNESLPTRGTPANMLWLPLFVSAKPVLSGAVLDGVISEDAAAVAGQGLCYRQ